MSLLSLGLGLGAPVPPLADGPFPRGTLIERVVCQDDESEAYALYLPTAYDAARRWPIVFALDARGRARLPVERLVSGAERYGFILASSYSSRSDTELDPTPKALGALWRDTLARFSVDERRAYAAGFSGTARTALRLADAVPGSLAGVIACGAGFAADRPPHAELAFAVFGIAGDADFNYQELQRLADTLESLGVAYRIESFQGGHDWPPAEVLADALAWFELRGMHEGRRAGEPALAARLRDRWQAEAAGLERDGRIVEAQRRHASLVRDLHGLADVGAARTTAERLRASPAYEADRRERLEWRRREQQYEASAQDALARLSVSDAAASLRGVLSDLRIAELRRRAEGGGKPDERLSARRSLARLEVQTSFYLPLALRQRGEHARAALVLAVAAELAPENPGVWYALARARAQAGWKRDAIEALGRAIEQGLSDAALLESELDLAPLHGESAYRELLAGLRARGSPARR